MTADVVFGMLRPDQGNTAAQHFRAFPELAHQEAGLRDVADHHISTGVWFSQTTGRGKRFIIILDRAGIVSDRPIGQADNIVAGRKSVSIIQLIKDFGRF